MAIINSLRHLLQTLPQKVKVGRTYVGPQEPVFIIAEIGINHNGSLEIAQQLIDVACAAGANAVKFQKRTTSEILTKEGLTKPYTSPHAFAPTYGEHREKLEFSEKQYLELKAYCQQKGILFFASVWDPISADFMEKIGTDAYKIPSADVTNLPLLEHVAQKNKPILLSTGMSTPAEIQRAVETILHFNNRLIIFHCLSLYPAPEDKINLAFMNSLQQRFAPLPIGYSGHEIDLLPTLAAVAMDATVIERHLTLDKTMKGSDHAGSLNPQEFKELIIAIRRLEKIKGHPQKIIYEELKPLREKLAKSLVAGAFIPQGAVITASMLKIKGPGYGIAPYRLKEVIGKKAKENIIEDTVIKENQIHW